MFQRIILVAILFLIITQTSAESAIQFIYPSSKSWVNNSGHLILKLNQLDCTGVRVTVNGLQSDMVDVASPEYRKLFQDFFIAQAMWDRGVNSVKIELFKDAQKIETTSTEIYLTGNSADSAAPPEFAPNTMHVTERESLCVGCHTMNPTPAQMNSTNPKANPCAGCHQKMLNEKYVHGPVGTFSCGYCHTNAGKPKHSVPKQGAALCYECHSDMSSQIQKLKLKHGPVEAGMCEACHDPHGSSNESQLIKPVNELCLSCHGHIAKNIHVVRGADGKSHPLTGKKDPSRAATGREMSCISCHNPHGGEFRYYFVNKSDGRLKLCQICHNQ